MLSHPTRRSGCRGGYLPAKVAGFRGAQAAAWGFALDAAALDAAAAVCSETGNVAPIFACAIAFDIALAEGLETSLDTGQGDLPCSPSSLDTGWGGFVSLTLAIFASTSTAAALLRAAAAKTAVLPGLPWAFGPLGFGIVAAAPADDACGFCHGLCVGGIITAAPAEDDCGVCQGFCFGGLSATYIGGACHAFCPGGELIVDIPAGDPGGRALDADGEPWMLPAMAAAVTDRRCATAAAAAALRESLLA